MAIFFIHIHNGTGEQRDDTGSEFTDGRQAIGEAAKMAGEILRDETRDELRNHALRMVIEGSDHRLIAEIDMSVSVTADNPSY